MDAAVAWLIAGRLGIPRTSLVAPADVVAGPEVRAQRIVQNILVGFFFIITERQYSFGDFISLAVPACQPRDQDRRRSHAAGDHSADRRRPGGHHPQKPDDPGDQSRATGRVPSWTYRCPPPWTSTGYKERASSTASTSTSPRAGSSYWVRTAQVAAGPVSGLRCLARSRLPGLAGGLRSRPRRALSRLGGAAVVTG